MGIINVLIGLLLLFWGWKIMSTLSETKMNRRFSSWVSERLSTDEAESYRMANGGVFAVMMFAGGLLFIVAGVGILLS
jgi:hypothetical protein